MCAENGQVGLVLEQKLGWSSSDEQAISVNTLATVLGSLGLAVGSQIAGKLLTRLDKKAILLYSNVLQLVIVAPLKLICSTPTILIGRFLFGFVNACSNLAFSQAMNDTVPSDHINMYGWLINSGFMLGILLSNMLGMLVPLQDKAMMREDEMWRVVYGFPVALQLFSVFALTVLFPEAEVPIEKIYELTSDEQRNAIQDKKTNKEVGMSEE